MKDATGSTLDSFGNISKGHLGRYTYFKVFLSVT